jgi:hypothetical protein
VSDLRTWEVRFLGDPEYGRSTWEGESSSATEVTALDSSTAARKALARWRAQDDNEDGWYGDGTILGVREIVPPPPVKTFIVADGRPKLERAKVAKK